TIRTGAISSCFTSTSTATTAPASAPAIRPDGPAWSPAACISSRRPPPRRSWRSGRRPRTRKCRRRRASGRAALLAGARGEMRRPRYPSLHQINTRCWLTELSRSLGRLARLDDVPDAELDRLAAMGFDWVWLLSVWQTGDAGRRISCAEPEWRREFQ